MSDSTTQNVPAVQKAIQALAAFKNKKMIFARKEDFENVSQQYQPVVTIVEFQASDFTRLGNDKSYYPSKGATNRIGDAAGVSFLEGAGGTREEGNATAIKVVEHKNGSKPSYFQIEGKYIVIGTAQGERLKPDGTPRRSSLCEYGYDVVQRTNEAILNDLTEDNPKLTSEIACRKKFLELQKFAVQKARTGSELAVIRELVGMNTGFNKADVEKGAEMLFSQVIENNHFRLQVLAEIGQTPDGRAAIVQALFGATRSIYGPGGPALTGEAPMAIASMPVQRTVDVESGEVLPQPPAGDLFDDSPAQAAAPEKTPIEKGRETLESYRPKLAISPKATKFLDGLLAKQDLSLAEISSGIDRFEAFLQSEREKGGAA